ncbi:MAG: hypothetical protein ACOC08_04135 [Campylobacterales bacterium]
MAFNDNLVKVDGYSGLFFRDKKRLLGDSKLLTKKDYPKLSNEQFLDFAIRVRINYKEFKHNIKGLRVANRTIKTMIEQANKEKEELVQKARNGNRAVIDKIKYDDVHGNESLGLKPGFGPGKIELELKIQDDWTEKINLEIEN